MSNADWTPAENLDYIIRRLQRCNTDDIVRCAERALASIARAHEAAARRLAAADALAQALAQVLQAWQHRCEDMPGYIRDDFAAELSATDAAIAKYIQR